MEDDNSLFAISYPLVKETLLVLAAILLVQIAVAAKLPRRKLVYRYPLFFMLQAPHHESRKNHLIIKS